MVDVSHHLGAVQRSVETTQRDGQAAKAVILSRVYDTDIGDLWDALTNAERIPRWFLPVSGDLKPGGRYQFQGNAGGEITDCEPPRRVAVTWEMQGQVNSVEVRLAPEGAQAARLTLTHTALLTPEAAGFWEQFGPGAVGTGWDGGFLGMALYLSDPDAPKPDENTFATTPEGRAFFMGSAEAWGEAAITSGDDPEAARAAAARTAGFYTGQPPGGVMHALDVLGDPVRRRILELLAEGEHSSGQIVAVVGAEFGITQAAVSQHLRVLRDSGFASVRPEGARRIYAVETAPLREVDRWLEAFRHFWEPKLDALATEVARGKRKRQRG